MEEPHQRNTEYTFEEIEELLKSIKECINKNNYRIELNENRKNNKEFILKYGITDKKAKTILLSLTPNDFNYSTYNTKKGYENKILYVFKPKVSLITLEGKSIFKEIYIKFNYLNNLFLIVISFHK